MTTLIIEVMLLLLGREKDLQIEMIVGRLVSRNHKGPCGCDKTSSEKTGDDVMIRCDGSITTKCASVKALGGGGGTAAPAAPATPAKSSFAMTVPLIPRFSLSS